jgi:hypothetical protein
MMPFADRFEWKRALETEDDRSEEEAGAIVTTRVEHLRRALRTTRQVVREMPDGMTGEVMMTVMKRTKGSLNPKDVDIAIVLVTTSATEKK